MTIEYQLTIDCADPGRLVTFSWRDYYLSVNFPAEELGDSDCTDRLIDPAGRAPGIWFQPVPEGKVVKNRLHLDLFVGGGRSVPLAQRRECVVAKVASLARAGATVVRTDDTPQHDHYSVLLQDPEGNEFCVV